MVRQAHTYLVGAMSGATLIAIAIGVFVVLVSAQVFRDWPLTALGGGDDSAVVSKAHEVGTATAGSAGAPLAATAGKVAPAAGGRANGTAGDGARSGSVAAGDGVTATGDLAPSGDRGESAGGGDQSGSGTAASPQSSSPAATPSGGNGSSSGGGSAGGSSGGGATGGGAGSGTSGTTPTTSAQVTETVNGTVAQVDETALGGTLHETGVTEVTEGVVNGVAGPESTVGKVVDETVGVVGGLLGGKR
jgi:hypothetical protein